MHIEKYIPILGFYSGILGLIWKGAKKLVGYIDGTYEPCNPKIWKRHNRVSGWALVVSSMIFSILAWHSFLTEGVLFFKVCFLVYSMIAMPSAFAFAVLQHRVWLRGDYFGRPVKTGFLDEYF